MPLRVEPLTLGSSTNAATTSVWIASMALLRVVLSDGAATAFIRSPTMPRTLATTSAGNSNFGYVPLALPTSRCMRSCRSISGWIDWWPNSNARTMVSSGTSLAPHSTMTIALRVPARRRSRSERCMSSNEGLMTNSPSIRPTRTAPTGPSKGATPKGTSEIVRAADAATMASTSGWWTWSTDSGVQTIWTSLRKSAGKSGRSGRSIRRAVRMAPSPGRPSRRKNEPGMRPAA